MKQSRLFECDALGHVFLRQEERGTWNAAALVRRWWGRRLASMHRKPTRQNTIDRDARPLARCVCTPTASLPPLHPHRLSRHRRTRHKGTKDFWCGRPAPHRHPPIPAFEHTHTRTHDENTEPASCFCRWMKKGWLGDRQKRSLR